MLLLGSLIYGDHSMKSAHERFLFTSYDASKIRTSERSEQVSVFDASPLVNKNSCPTST